VGGIHAGGTGKTPLAGLLAQHFTTKGLTVVLASRGYRRVLHSPCVRAPDQPAPWEAVGDEPSMLRKRIPGLWLAIGPDRCRMLRRARTLLPAGAPSVAILDDGFQHRQLHRDVDIVCLPPDPWLERMLPAGRLREPLRSLRRAHIVCLIGSEADEPRMQRDAARVRSELGLTDVFVVVNRPGEWVCARTGETRRSPGLAAPAAVCGIARPERFLQLISRQGITTASTLTFPDHHQYTAHDVARIGQNGSDGILTTEKDAERLCSQTLAIRLPIWYLTVRHDFAGAGSQEQFLAAVERRTLRQEAVP
jgi:tetraacyldisaccharide 4'-kinase